MRTKTVATVDLATGDCVDGNRVIGDIGILPECPPRFDHSPKNNDVTVPGQRCGKTQQHCSPANTCNNGALGGVSMRQSVYYTGLTSCTPCRVLARSVRTIPAVKHDNQSVRVRLERHRVRVRPPSRKPKTRPADHRSDFFLPLCISKPKLGCAVAAGLCRLRLGLPRSRAGQGSTWRSRRDSRDSGKPNAPPIRPNAATFPARRWDPSQPRTAPV